MSVLSGDPQYFHSPPRWTHSPRPMVQGDVLHDGQTQTRATHFTASRGVTR